MLMFGVFCLGPGIAVEMLVAVRSLGHNHNQIYQRQESIRWKHGEPETGGNLSRMSDMIVG